MACGYQRTDPIKLFSDMIGFYAKQIQAAEAQGFTGRRLLSF